MIPEVWIISRIPYPELTRHTPPCVWKTDEGTVSAKPDWSPWVTQNVLGKGIVDCYSPLQCFLRRFLQGGLSERRTSESKRSPQASFQLVLTLCKEVLSQHQGVSFPWEHKICQEVQEIFMSVLEKNQLG